MPVIVPRPRRTDEDDVWREDAEVERVTDEHDRFGPHLDEYCRRLFAPHLITKLMGDVTSGPSEQLFPGVENQPLHGGD
jgi:hypothetical protein